MEPIGTAEDDHGRFRWNTPSIPAKDTVAIRLLKRVCKVYGHMSGVGLAQLTHEHGGHWQVTRNRYPSLRKAVIPNPVMRDHFARKLKANAGT